MRGRGLKRYAQQARSTYHVAPHAGAWIETNGRAKRRKLTPSPPMRGRGLKHITTHCQESMQRSPPMRGRGLKHLFGPDRPGQSRVAPHAGAWIETPH